MSKRITSPLDDNTIKDLKAGDQVLINGIIYTARDSAHNASCQPFGIHQIADMSIR